MSELDRFFGETKPLHEALVEKALAGALDVMLYQASLAVGVLKRGAQVDARLPQVIAVEVHRAFDEVGDQLST